MTSMDNTPDSPAKTPEGYTTQGGNFWTLITPEIWKVLHAVLQGRREDSKKWLTEAAKCGDTEAMRQLIEEFDHGDLVRCWTWLYLAEMLGSDLTKDNYHAIHEDGSAYDDDVGGPIFADGRDGVRLEPISADQQATARQNAAEMFRVIRDDE